MNPGSPAIILDLAREQQQAVVQSANDLDTKAATLLGFAGLLLGLLFSSDLAASHWNGLFTTGAALLGFALLPLGTTLYPLKLTLNPDLQQLTHGSDRQAPGELELLVATSLQRSIRAAASAVRIKSQLVRAGSVLIALGAAVVASRFVSVLSTAETSTVTVALREPQLLYL